MSLEKRLGPPQESFWKSLLSDLQNAGFLRGRSPHALDHAPAFNSHLDLPLAEIDPRGINVAPETALMGAWAIVLSRHTGSRDILFFSSFDPRRPWLAPIRVDVPAASAVAEWLPEFETWLKKAESNGPMPTSFLNQPRESGLARTLPAFLIIPRGAKAFPPRDQIKGPLLVVIRLDIGKIEMHYDSAWFEQADIRSLADHLNLVLAGMARAPQTALGRLPILTETERSLLLTDWNKTAVPFEEKCIHEFFEEQAARHPEAIAVTFCDQSWTYRELNDQAGIVADRLRARGVGPGTFVAICLNRSLELMATLFGVLKAGGAYLPLDPAYPAERLAFMIEDTQPAVTVVSKQTADVFPKEAKNLLWIDDAREPEIADAGAQPTARARCSDAAYVLYTSGSTGKPKGVVITHRNVSNFFTAMDGVIGTDPGVWLAVTSISFDISVFELFWTMARGFRIVLQEEGQWASQSGSKFALPQQFKRHAVTHFQCTPSLASMLLSDSESVGAIKGLRRFMVGGEPLPLDLAHKITEAIAGDLVNLYGQTETTVWSASQHVRRRESQILIGRPVANTQLYVLDPQRELVPISSVGELYIGGDGLAREYLNRPDITAERFITHEFTPGKPERLYRTGDVVRYMRDGRLEFIGRIDQQIKIRGVRVELGEIEVALREHPGIRDAAVIVQELDAEDKRLVAYVITQSKPEPATAAIQQFLGGKLPKAIIPSAILFLDEFPKTPNGKLDRRALPKPDQKASVSVEGAANHLERSIAAIWCEALGVESVGLEDRFFDIGGHSLLMIEVHDRIRGVTRLDVTLLDLFQYPTIRSLAHHLGQRTRAAANEATGLNRGKLRKQLTARNGSVRKQAGI